MTSRTAVVALIVALMLSCPLLVTRVDAQSADASSELLGLWKAKRRFGPDARGQLTIQKSGNAYMAEMVGRSVPVQLNAGELSFDLPNAQGTFRGKLLRSGAIQGVWFPPRGMAHGGYATPVTLMAAGANRWQGDVVPFDDAFTMYLLVRRQPDGTLGALMRNAERDWAVFLGINKINRSGDVVQLLGRPRGQTRDTVVLTGVFDTAQKMLTFNLQGRGGTYDFRRENDESDYYPRGKNPGRYVYRAPLARNDGWLTGSIDDARIDRAAVEQFIQLILDMSMDSTNAPQFHGLLIARNGRLVLEEYFHGEHRDQLHDTRSGSKSVTATIIGAAMQAGAPLKLSMPVYQVMNRGAFPPNLEPRKRAMTLEHLLTMSSGFFCDDNNDDAPGREDRMWQEASDFYQFTLALPMATAPGEKAVYCSGNPNLALGVAGTALNESPYYLFHRLVAEPLNIRRYAWALDPARHPYGGGGMQFLPRDFMKFGQLMLDSGMWHGRRILSREFVARATTPLYRIGPSARGYGLLWWPDTLQYGTSTARRFSALGAGGQTVMVFPDLDLIVATYGGNYASAGWRYVTGEFITRYVLPAVRR